MKFKLNPLTGEFDYTSDSANKEKLNPMTGEFNLVEGDGPFSQIFNPLTGTFNLSSGGGGGIIAEVTGNGYINLTNAVAHRLMELKAYGGTEQDLTPTPATPVDIVCNNGVLKLSPNLVDFNETRIDSDTWAVADKTKGFEVNADVYNKTVGSAMLTNANCFGIFVPCEVNESVSINFFDYVPGGGRCYCCEITADRKCNTTPVQYASNTGTLTQTTFTLTQPDSIGFVIEWYVTATQTRNYTKENYMIVRGATQPTAYMPYGIIYADGTTETIKAIGKNLFDTQWQSGIYSTATGEYSPAANRISNVNMIQVKPSTSYVVSCPSYELGTGMRWLFYDANKNFISAITNGATAITTPSNAKYINFYIANNLTVDTAPDLQLEQGSTATDYEAYYNGGTSIAKMLLKIGNYVDEQEILSGNITRKVGIKVLDGTENWNYYSVTQGNLFRMKIDDGPEGAKDVLGVLCNYYNVVTGSSRTDGTLTGSAQNYDFINNNYSDLTDWKQYVKDLYTAGQPIIVVYPLATPTTETVTGQPMNIQTGTNTIEITQASIDNLPLYAKYLQSN